MVVDSDRKWSCGHIAGSVCAERNKQLIERAHALAEENQRLREAMQDAPRPAHDHDGWIANYRDWYFKDRVAALATSVLC